MNIYSEPEKFGLATVGEIEWSDACYQFDLTVVWRDTTTGAMYFGNDSGCSCPEPFASMGRNELTVIDRPQTLIAHVNARIADMETWNDVELERAKGVAGELVQKVRGLLR
jgi:hypothetical protein